MNSLKLWINLELIMNKILCSFLFLFLSLCSFGQGYSDSISVNFFLLEECRISQNISGEIRYTIEHFSKGGFDFKGYFSGELSSNEKMIAFMSDYKLNMPYFLDSNKLMQAYYGAEVAPEVIVYDEKRQEILYKGRIDNSYADVGVRRRVVTSRDLRKVLQEIVDGKAISTKRTKAIGCYLNH